MLYAFRLPLLPIDLWLYRQVMAPAQVQAEVNKSVSRPRHATGGKLNPLDDMIKVPQDVGPNEIAKVHVRGGMRRTHFDRELTISTAGHASNLTTHYASYRCPRLCNSYKKHPRVS